MRDPRRIAPPADIVYPEIIGFSLVHLAALGAFWTGVNSTDIAICVALYLVRMFGITAGYHRYFAHRTFKTNRIFAFLLALMGAMSSQRGPLWWASLHRDHHKHSDTPEDIHSPIVYGFWFSHFGWIFSKSKSVPDLDNIKDFTRFPELRLLDRFPWAVPIATAATILALGGWSAFFFGFCFSTVLTWHATFAINSIAHVMGRRVYITTDESRNNWLLAIATLGEGWHNNHHYFQSSTRQGFQWWEYDVTYYILRGLQSMGLVWDIKEPPRAVVEGNRALPPRLVEAGAARVNILTGLQERVERFREQMDGSTKQNLRENLQALSVRWEQQKEEWDVASKMEALAELREKLNLPVELPSPESVMERTREMFRKAHAGSRDEVAVQAYVAMLTFLAAPAT